MKIDIELTPEEIIAFKEKYMREKLDLYNTPPTSWEVSNFKDGLLQEIRKKHEYGKEFYLTPEFKKELSEMLAEQVKTLVDKEIADNKRFIKNHVQRFVAEHFETI